MEPLQSSFLHQAAQRRLQCSHYGEYFAMRNSKVAIGLSQNTSVHCPCGSSNHFHRLQQVHPIVSVERNELLIIGDSMCIRKKYIELIWLEGKCFCQCFSEDGIFVNDCYCHNPGILYCICLKDELLTKACSHCLVYIPSTNTAIKIHFHAATAIHPCSEVTAVPYLKERERFPDFLCQQNERNPQSGLTLTNLKMSHMNKVPVPSTLPTSSTKPPFSYSQLIIQAILSAPRRMLQLKQIYEFISTTYPYFKYNDKRWQNSIRHNLSLNRHFIRIPRSVIEVAYSAGDRGLVNKGSFWSLDPHYAGSHFSKQAYVQRRWSHHSHHGQQTASDNHTDIREDTDNIPNTRDGDPEITISTNTGEWHSTPMTQSHVMTPRDRPDVPVSTEISAFRRSRKKEICAEYQQSLMRVQEQHEEHWNNTKCTDTNKMLPSLPLTIQRPSFHQPQHHMELSLMMTTAHQGYSPCVTASSTSAFVSVQNRKKELTKEQCRFPMQAFFSVHHNFPQS